MGEQVYLSKPCVYKPMRSVVMGVILLITLMLLGNEHLAGIL